MKLYRLPNGQCCYKSEYRDFLFERAKSYICLIFLIIFLSLSILGTIEKNRKPVVFLSPLDKVATEALEKGKQSTVSGEIVDIQLIDVNENDKSVDIVPVERVRGVNTSYSIEQDIKDVFGKDTNKAMLLLTGNGCAENRSLNPKAKNVNEGSIDRGVFQINDKWQGFGHQGKADQFLYDPKINIRIAYRIFVDEGYSFNKWTCGRYYGI